MIDNPDQVDRLLSRLRAALPLPAFGSPSLMATLRDKFPRTGGIPRCTIRTIHYLGDGGGIMCELTFDGDDGTEVCIASITHLKFDRRLPMARDIATYQKHRTKRIWRERMSGPAERGGGLTVVTPRPV